MSLSARRAWIEIASGTLSDTSDVVALRKESVDRNDGKLDADLWVLVALRKESVDRNLSFHNSIKRCLSLSARRAWIEISVYLGYMKRKRSLSARRAWIEISLPGADTVSH